jgi:menaquinone-dependent protoporphyrinogen oxidase
MKEDTMKVLVTFATAHGSTRGVAERIAGRLEARGHEVTVQAADAVDSFAWYDAAVVGSAIHNGRWLPDAADLVMRDRRDLAGRPAWFFSVSLLGDEETAFPSVVTRVLRELRARTRGARPFPPGVEPRAHRWFGGAIAPEHWSRAGRVSFAVMQGRYGDHRDWSHVDAWADSIADGLEPDRSTGTRGKDFRPS